MLPYQTSLFYKCVGNRASASQLVVHLQREDGDVL